MGKSISGSILGGDITGDMEAGSPAEVFTKMNMTGTPAEYTVMVNGSNGEMNQTLNDGDFITFTKAQKGASGWGRDAVLPSLPSEVPSKVVFDTPILNITRLEGGEEYRVNGTKVTSADLGELYQALADEDNE